MAIGIEVVPTERPVITTGTAGKKYPIPIPTAIARKIHRVRYRSRNESCFPVAMFAIPDHLYENFQHLPPHPQPHRCPGPSVFLRGFWAFFFPSPPQQADTTSRYPHRCSLSTRPFAIPSSVTTICCAGRDSLCCGNLFRTEHRAAIKDNNFVSVFCVRKSPSAPIASRCDAGDVSISFLCQLDCCKVRELAGVCLPCTGKDDPFRFVLLRMNRQVFLPFMHPRSGTF